MKGTCPREHALHRLRGSPLTLNLYLLLPMALAFGDRFTYTKKPPYSWKAICFLLPIQRRTPINDGKSQEKSPIQKERSKKKISHVFSLFSLYLFYNIFVDSNGDEKERRRVWRMGSDTLTGRGNSHGLATTDDDSARTWDAQVNAGEIYGDLSDQRGHLAFFLCLFILLLCMLVFFVCFLYYYYY
jgi:hypothetical protein